MQKGRKLRERKSNLLIPVGTLGGGRKTLDCVPDIASVTLKFLEASLVIWLLSVEAVCCCMSEGIVLE